MHIKRPRNIQIPTVKFTPCLMCCISNFFNFLPRIQQQKNQFRVFSLVATLLAGGGRICKYNMVKEKLDGTDLMIGKTFPAEFVFALFTIMEFYR